MEKQNRILNQIPKIKFGNSNQFYLIAGPCAIEGEQMAFQIAEKLIDVTDRLEIPFIFKGSYRKANRSRLDSFTGIGDEKALQILKSIGEKLNIPVTSDIHSVSEVNKASEAVDILQIPAFLCRQTDLLVAAAQTGKVINIKKGQFMSPASMQFALTKIVESGNEKVILTERGNSFGYQDLVVDYRSIPIMKSFGASVVLDCTHALQKPNQEIGVTNGQPEYIETIAKAGVATGADGLFIETHPNPKQAKSDGANMLHLDDIENLLKKLSLIRKAYNMSQDI